MKVKQSLDFALIGKQAVKKPENKYKVNIKL